MKNLSVLTTMITETVTSKSSIGELKIEVPQDRKSSFEPQVVKKGQKDISGIAHKIISMYAKGMTTRQISSPPSSETCTALMFLKALFVRRV